MNDRTLTWCCGLLLVAAIGVPGIFYVHSRAAWDDFFAVLDADAAAGEQEDRRMQAILALATRRADEEPEGAGRDAGNAFASCLASSRELRQYPESVADTCEIKVGELMRLRGHDAALAQEAIKQTRQALVASGMWWTRTAKQ